MRDWGQIILRSSQAGGGWKIDHFGYGLLEDILLYGAKLIQGNPRNVECMDVVHLICL